MCGEASGSRARSQGGPEARSREGSLAKEEVGEKTSMTKKKKSTPAVKVELAFPADLRRACPLCGSDVVLQAKRGSMSGLEVAGWGECSTCGLWFIVRPGTPAAEMV